MYLIFLLQVRSAMGVTLMRTHEDEKVVAIAKILSSYDSEKQLIEGNQDDNATGGEVEDNSEINNIEE